MKVKCIDASGTALVKEGNVYDVIKEDEIFYAIIAEDGCLNSMCIERFEIVSEDVAELSQVSNSSDSIDFTVDLNEFGTTITMPKKLSIKQINKILEILEE